MVTEEAKKKKIEYIVKLKAIIEHKRQAKCYLKRAISFDDMLVYMVMTLISWQ